MIESKFKVGDKVRFKEEIYNRSILKERGYLTISKISYDEFYKKNLINTLEIEPRFWEYRLKLVEEAQQEPIPTEEQLISSAIKFLEDRGYLVISEEEVEEEY